MVSSISPYIFNTSERYSGETETACAARGHPWLNTTGGPAPLSFWQACVPFFVVIVLVVFLSCFGGTSGSFLHPALPRPDPFRGVADSLFRRFAVEVFVVGLRVGAGMVDDAVPMIRGRINRIELQ